MQQYLSTRRKKAFTLTEILLVIVIIGLLFVLIVTRLNNTTDKARLAGVQNDFKAWQTACELTAQEHSGFTSLVITSSPSDPKITKDNPDLSKLVEALNEHLDSEYKLYIVTEENDGQGRKIYEIASDKTDPWGEVYRIEYRHEEGTNADGTIWKLDEGELIFTSVNADLVYHTSDDYVMVCGYEAAGEAYEMNTRMDAYKYVSCGHAWTWTHIKDATCEEYGSDKGVCSSCHAEKYRMIEPLGHARGASPIRTDAATCETTGAKYYECTRCGKEFADVIAAKGHTPGPVTPAKAATCTEPGYSEYCECTVCHKILEAKVETPALGHLRTEQPVVTAATCWQEGSIKQTCPRCGTLIVDEKIDKCDHELGEWQVVTPATETTDGVERRKCANYEHCHYAETRPISKLAHTHSYTYTTVPATCTTTGTKIGTCSCGDTTTETIPATGHSINGTTYYTIPTAWQACTSSDAYTYQCSNCHQCWKEGSSEPSHTHTYSSAVTKQPTCTEAGVETFTCTVDGCGNSYTKSIAALGHQIGSWSSDNDNHWHVCGRSGCGAVLDKAEHAWDAGTVTTEPTTDKDGVRTYKCTVCAKTKTEAIPKHVHTAGDWTTVQKGSCADGTKKIEVRKCKDCGAEVDRRETAVAHVLTHHVEVPATCTTDGYTAGDTCANCSYDTRTKKPATGHTTTKSVTAVTRPGINKTGSYTLTETCTKCSTKVSETPKTLSAVSKISLASCTGTISQDKFKYTGSAFKPSVTSLQYTFGSTSNDRYQLFWYMLLFGGVSMDDATLKTQVYKLMETTGDMGYSKTINIDLTQYCTIGYVDNMNVGTGKVNVTPNKTDDTNPYKETKTFNFTIYDINVSIKNSAGVDFSTIHTGATLSGVKVVVDGDASQIANTTMTISFSPTGVLTASSLNHTAHTFTLTAGSVSVDMDVSMTVVLKNNTTSETVATATKTIKVTCHNKGTKITGKAATCTATGLTDGYKCSLCGATTQAQTTIAALGHLWGDWYTTTTPGPGVAGEQRHDCTRTGCSAYETQALAAGKIPLSDCVITLKDKTFVYDGAAKTYSASDISVEYKGETVAAKYYNVTYDNNVNAGEGTAKIIITATSATDNPYTGSNNKAFTIQKQTVTLTVSAIGIHCAGGTAASSQTVSLGNWKTGFTTTSVTCSDTSKKTTAYVNDGKLTVSTTLDSMTGGSYTVTIAVDGGQNYTVNTLTVNVTVGAHNKATKITGTAATCTATGKTDGYKCSICGKITTAQSTISALGHNFDYTGAVPTLDTTTERGYLKVTGKCTRCTETQSKPFVIPWSDCTFAIDGSTSYNINTDGTAITPSVKITYKASSTLTLVWTVGPTSATVNDGTGTYSITYFNNLSYANNVKAGTASVTVTAKSGSPFGSTQQTKTLNFTIVKRAASIKWTNTGGTQITTASVNVYSTLEVTLSMVGNTAGVSIAPTTSSYVSVTRSGSSVAITGLSAGTVTLTATLPENDYYKAASATLKVTVSKVALPEEPVDDGKPWVVTIEPLSDVPYDGTAHTTAVTVTCNGATVPSSEYSVSHSTTAIDVGKVTVSVTANSGSQKITGTTQASFNITKRNVVITKPTDITLAVGGTQTVSVTRKVDDNSKLVASSAVPLPTLSYSSSDTGVATVDSAGKITACGVGTATITVTSADTTNYYEATTWFTVKVNAADISGATIKLSTNTYTYDGTDRKPVPTVTMGGKTLVAGTDYTVTGYANNKVPGTASVTIAGKGNYTGTKTATFTINKIAYNASNLVIALNSSRASYDTGNKRYVYTYDGIDPMRSLAGYVFVISDDGQTLTCLYTGTTAPDVSTLTGMADYTNRIKVKYPNIKNVVCVKDTGSSVSYTHGLSSKTPSTTAAKYTVLFANSAFVTNGTNNGTTILYQKASPVLLVVTKNTGNVIGTNMSREIRKPFDLEVYIAIKVGTEYYIGTNSDNTALVTYNTYNASRNNVKLYVSGAITGKNTDGKLTVGPFSTTTATAVSVGTITPVSVGTAKLTLSAAASTNFNAVSTILKLDSGTWKTEGDISVKVEPTEDWYVVYTGTPLTLPYDGYQPVDVTINEDDIRVILRATNEVVDKKYYTLSYGTKNRIGYCSITATAKTTETGCPITGTQSTVASITGDVYLEAGYNDTNFNYHASRLATLSTIKNFVVDTWSNAYAALFTWENGTNVALSDTGMARLFYTNTADYPCTLFLLVPEGTNHIYANGACDQMFQGMSSVRVFNLGKISFELTTSMQEMFDGCTAMTNGDVLKHASFPLVTNMGYMFQNCSALQSVDFGDNTLSLVTDMNHMFAGCGLLNQINNVNKWQASPTNTSYMFNRCASLLSAPQFDMSKTANASYMFYQCTSLQTIILSSTNTQSLQNATSMFYGDTSLKWADIKTFGRSSGSGGVIITNMFTGCTSLTFIFADNDPAVASGYSSKKVFTNANNLRGGMGTKYATGYDSGSYFKRDTASKKGLLTGRDAMLKSGADMRTSIAKALPAMIMSSTSYNLVYGTWIAGGYNYGLGDWYTPTGLAVTQADTDYEYVDVADGLVRMFGKLESDSYVVYVLAHERISNIYANADCSYMYARDTGTYTPTLIDYPSGYISYEKTTNASYMFAGTSITAIKLDYDMPNVTDISYMFSRCTNVEEINLAQIQLPPKVTNIAGLFAGCSSVVEAKTVDPFFDTSNITDMSHLFEGCSQMKGVPVKANTSMDITGTDPFILDLSGFNTEKATTMESMFDGCKALTYIDIRSFTNIAVNNINYMFRNCTSLIHIYAQQWNENIVFAWTMYPSYTTNPYHFSDTFVGDTKLKGGAGTTYAAMNEFGAGGNGRYAMYDHGSSASLTGYFFRLADTDGDTLESGPQFNVHLGKLSTKSSISKVAFMPRSSYYNQTALNDVWDNTDSCLWVDARHEGTIRMCKFGSTIYVFIDDSIASNFKKIYFNSDCSYMFQGLSHALLTISMDGVDTTKMTNMNYMYAGIKRTSPPFAITDITDCTLTTANVTTMVGTFQNTTADTANAIIGDANFAFTTANVVNMSYMFSNINASQITCVQNGTLTTTLVRSAVGMFANANGTASGDVDISKLNFNALTNASSMFEGSVMYQGYASIKMCAMPTLTTASAMFAYNAQLKDVYMSFIKDAANLSNVSYMFAGCTSLVGHDMKLYGETETCFDCSMLKGTSWTNSSYMFYGCTSLQNIAFYTPGQAAGEYFVVPQNDKYISAHMFSDDTSLRHIYVGADIGTFSGHGHGTAMFNNCTNIQGSMGTTYDGGQDSFGHIDYGANNRGYLYYPAGGYAPLLLPGPYFNTVIKSLTDIDKATSFQFVTSKTQAVQAGAKPVDVGGTGSIQAFVYSNTLYVVLDAKYGNTIFAAADCSQMFQGLTDFNTAITSTNFGILNTCGVNIGPQTNPIWLSVSSCVVNGTTISGPISYAPVKNTTSMFEGCTGLPSVSFEGSNFTMPYVYKAASMFNGDTSLTKVTLTAINTERAGCTNGKVSSDASFAFMFAACSNLNSVNTEVIDMGAVYNTNNMFENCTKLTTITMEAKQNCQEYNMYNASKMFAGMTKLTTVTLGGDKVLAFSSNVSYMFENCTELKSLNLSCVSINSLEADYMFHNCTKLKKIIFNSAQNSTQFSGGNHNTTYWGCVSMFDGCSELTTLENWSSVKGNDTIHNVSRMFYGCNALTSIDLTKFATGELQFFSDIFGGRTTTLTVNVDVSGGMQLKADDATDFKEKYCGGATEVTYDKEALGYVIKP